MVSGWDRWWLRGISTKGSRNPAKKHIRAVTLRVGGPRGEGEIVSFVRWLSRVFFTRQQG